MFSIEAYSIWVGPIGSGEHNQRCPIESIHPIELTQEWFLKLGFKVFDHSVRPDLLLFIDSSGQFRYNPTFKHLRILTTGVAVKIKYVHELQNFMANQFESL